MIKPMMHSDNIPRRSRIFNGLCVYVYTLFSKNVIVAKLFCKNGDPDLSGLCERTTENNGCKTSKHTVKK